MPANKKWLPAVPFLGSVLGLGELCLGPQSRQARSRGALHEDQAHLQAVLLPGSCCVYSSRQMLHTSSSASITGTARRLSSMSAFAGAAGSGGLCSAAARVGDLSGEPCSLAELVPAFELCRPSEVSQENMGLPET